MITIILIITNCKNRYLIENESHISSILAKFPEAEGMLPLRLLEFKYLKLVWSKRCFVASGECALFSHNIPKRVKEVPKRQSHNTFSSDQ